MGWSLSSKITLSLGSLMLVAAALVTALTFVQVRKAAIGEKQALVDVMNYTFETLLSQEAVASLQRVVENNATNSDVQKIVVVDRAGVVLASRELAAAARRLRDGDRKLRSRIRRNDEIGLLSETFDDMATEVEAILSGLEGQVAARTADLEAQRGALEKALADLHATTAARLALADTVRELSTPVIKLYDRILVLPLIGNIDAERALQIEGSLLDGIAEHGASEVILDLTGIPFVDTKVAASLMQAATAARLIGAGVTIVGIQAHVAQSIVHLGVDFSGITTLANLERGLLHALRKLGLSVAKVSEGKPSS